MPLLEQSRPAVPEHAREYPRRPRWVGPAAVASLLAAALVTGAVGTTVLLRGHDDADATSSAPPAAAGDQAAAGSSGSAGAAGSSGVAGAAGAGSQGASGPASAGSGSPGGSGTSSGTGSSSSAASRTKVTGFRSLSPTQATRALSDAGVAPVGEVRDAITWKDRNGTNLVVAGRTIAVAKDANGVETRTGTIRVVHVARTESARPVVLRTMTDTSGVPCELDLSTDVASDFAVAADLNGDGYGEVSVSWYSACRSDPGTFLVKTALLSNGSKYILRGVGWVGGKPDVPGEWGDGKVTDTEPAASRWPAGFHQPTTNVFLRLFRG